MHTNNLCSIISFSKRRDSGFVEAGDFGSIVDMKDQKDNSDGIIGIPKRRKMGNFSMDVSTYEVEEDHDRIVNKYKQVS